MKELFLKKLDETDKDLWVEYWEDFYKSGNMSEEKFNKFPSTNWTGKLYYVRSEENSPSQLHIYYLMEDGKMIGRIYIHIKPEFLSKDIHDGSHISYQVMPSKRKQGYGTEMLHLGLEKCSEFGLKEVIVTCDVENIGSAKMIENNYGILESIGPNLVEVGHMQKNYKIEVEDSLNKYNSKVKK